MRYVQRLRYTVTAHVEKYDRANNRASSQCWQPMLAVNMEPMIDRGLDDKCGPVLACYVGPEIAPDYRPRITTRVKPTIIQIYNDNKI